MRRSEVTNRRNVEDNERKKYLFIVVMWLILIFMISSLVHSLQILDEKVEILELVEEDVEKLRMDNLALMLERREVVSYDYIEKEARDKLRYGEDGEIVAIIPEDLITSSVIEEELRVSKGLEIEEGYRGIDEIVEVWIDFLFVDGV